jgi:hypothetical protein
MLFNYIVDPYQFYRQPRIYEVSYFDNQRIQNPGLARNYNYDSAIIGTSMTENFVGDRVSQVLGGSYIKLSISGSSAREQNLILNVALKHRELKNIIWGIDFGSLKGDSNRVENEQFSFPYYLYDDNPLNDILYLINKDTLMDSFKVIYQKKDVHMTNNLNDLNVWGHNFLYGEEQVKASYDTMMNLPILWEEYTYEYLENNFNINVLPILKKEDNTYFQLYFPPYSIYHMKLFEEKGVLDDFLRFKEYLVEATKDLNYVELYDFQDLDEITMYLNYYKDTSHHSPEVNEIILEAMALGQHRLTETNVQEKNKRLKEQVRTYFE